MESWLIFKVLELSRIVIRFGWQRQGSPMIARSRTGAICKQHSMSKIITQRWKIIRHILQSSCFRILCFIYVCVLLVLSQPCAPWRVNRSLPSFFRLAKSKKFNIFPKNTSELSSFCFTQSYQAERNSTILKIWLTATTITPCRKAKQ